MSSPSLLAVVTATVLAVPGMAAGNGIQPQERGQGSTVYSEHCARCHGKEGQGRIGPPVLGPEAWLSNYGTGRRLYDYVRRTMPQDKPRSLSERQYRAVVTYLLRRNGYVSSEESLSREELEAVSLEKASRSPEGGS